MSTESVSVTCSAVRSASSRVEATIVLVTAESVQAGLENVGVDRMMLESSGFTGKSCQVHSQSYQGSSILGLVGLGRASEVSTAILRRVGAAAARSWKRHTRVAVNMETVDALGIGIANGCQALVEGIILGSYRFMRYRSEISSAQPDITSRDISNGGIVADDSSERPQLSHVEIVGSDSKSAVDAVAKGTAIAAAVCLVRDLVNEPGGSLTPTVFASRAVEVARESGLRYEVWDEQDIKKQKLGGLLGVNRGSTQPPRFVRITYNPHSKDTNTSLPKIALVGKGITFDSGGLSIKRSKPMMTMKMDMAGAAAIVGVMSVLPAVDAQVCVEAYLPITDNMLGGDATRPGDVLTIRNGKTIEVANTDAEGRLILADALSLASEDKPDAIVDLATLTGACMVALGPKIAGLMGNNETWIKQVRDAADAAGERVWPLPLPADYEKQFASDVADIKNMGQIEGGALTAGLILQHFVDENIPWAHLDIAGPAFVDDEDGEICKGGTGFGVRTLVKLLTSFSQHKQG
ncbi:MAG: leucyl aminopeptidase [Acidimicrobiaceae bacterium]|nr:leucyl aminopeptidase [Acidimicrobiaceae bacterium]